MEDLTALKGQRILVTGATGKVGYRLVSSLVDRGYRVSALTRDCSRARSLWPDSGVLDCRQADLTVSAELPPALSGIGCVFHLASYAPVPEERDVYNAPSHWPVTAEGTANLVEAALQSGVERLIYVSSVKAMGDAAGVQGFVADESTVPAPEDLYGRAKLAAERSVLEAGARGRMHVCVLRLPMVYGLGGAGNIPRMVAAVAKRRFPPWPKVENRRVAVHADDAIQAALLAARSPKAAGQVYLVTDGATYSTRWIYEQILLALNRPLPRWRFPLWALKTVAAIGSGAEALTRHPMPLNRTALRKLTGDAWFSSQKIQRDLGFRPQHNLRNDILRMVSEYSETSSS